MNFTLPKVYPITDTKLSGLSHLEQVEKLATGGATFIQLRDKHSTPQEFYEAARQVMEYARSRNIKIIINDCADIALAVKADGVHLGQDDLPPAEARKFLGENAIIGFSTHSAAQVVAASSLPLDYIAIGAVFPTASKEKPEAIVGIEGVREAREIAGRIPLVAIGGINFENAPDVWKAGADSIAVIGAIVREPEKITENIGNFLALSR